MTYKKHLNKCSNCFMGIRRYLEASNSQYVKIFKCVLTFMQRNNDCKTRCGILLLWVARLAVIANTQCN